MKTKPNKLNLLTLFAFHHRFCQCGCHGLRECDDCVSLVIQAWEVQ